MSHSRIGIRKSYLYHYALGIPPRPATISTYSLYTRTHPSWVELQNEARYLLCLILRDENPNRQENSTWYSCLHGSGHIDNSLWDGCGTGN
jgi:hypothetical protein